MRRAPALVAVLALLAGCSRCSRRPPGPPAEHFLPAAAPVAIVAPSLRAAAGELGGLYRTVSAVPLASEIAESFAAVRSQLGFDPLDPAGLAAAGLDPDASAGAAFGSGPPLLVLPVADTARFDAFVLRLARARMGADHRITTQISGRPIVTYQRAPKSAAALAYTIVDGRALLAPGPQGPATVAAAAGAQGASLAESPAFKAALAALGPGFSAFAFAPAGSPALAATPFLRDGAGLGLRAGTRLLALRAAVLMTPDRAAWWKALLGDTGQGVPRGGAAEAEKLTPDAAVVARFAGDLGAVARRLSTLSPRGEELLSRLGIDPARDLAPLLAPGAVMSLAIAPTLQLTDLSTHSFDAAHADPFRTIHAALLARVKDPAAAGALLARVRSSGRRGGARVEAPGPGRAVATHLFPVGQGQVAIAILEDGRLAASGAAQFQALRDRILSGGKGFAPPSETARSALDAGGLAVVVDARRLVESVRALPEEAFGEGPNAFVLRSLAERFLDPASRVDGATLRVDPAPGAVAIDLVVEGREGEPPRP